MELQHLILFEKFNTNPDAYYIDRHKSWRQSRDEIEKKPDVSKFIENFNKQRDNIYKNFDGFEIKPALSNPLFMFISDRDIERGWNSTMYQKLKAEPGDIYAAFNDEHIIMRGDKNNTYSYFAKDKTRHNVSSTKESRDAINLFHSLISGLRIRFTKEEIPNIYRRDI